MNIRVLIRLLLCVVIAAFFLYAYISKQNNITELRLQIPIVAVELEDIIQDNTRLQFEIDRFENPQTLMHLSREPQFSHLKYPMLKEIIILEVP